MNNVNLNLEQPKFVATSQGEGILQNSVRAEDSESNFGSKLKSGESYSQQTMFNLETSNNVEAMQQNNPVSEEEQPAMNSKFKSVEALTKAYDNLQSDYTKKCQTLAKLQKEIEENKAKALPDNNLFLNFKQQLDNFVLTNPNAKNYESEIAKLVLTNNQIANSKNPLQEAWDFYKQNNFISVEDLKNSSFLNSYIQNNKDLKKQIINDYFSTISLQKTPDLISVSGSEPIIAIKQKPKNIKEASKLVEDIFS